MQAETPGSARGDVAPGRLRDRLLWLCPLASLLIAAAILWLFGLTLWTVVVAALLIGCPVAIVWALLAARTGKRDPSRTTG